MNKAYRISPSPTGRVHLGTARTALVSYVLAKKEDAKFHLRLEDTDTVRSTEQFASDIVDSIDWLGMKFEPTVVKQSEQESSGVYRSIADMLVQAGAAYYCDCSKQSLQEMKAQQIRTKARLGYIGVCRNRGHEGGTLRLNMARVREILDDNDEYGGMRHLRFNDNVFGSRHVDLRDLTDVVLMRSNGLSTYIFANTVDDTLAGVSHIVRGADILPQTAIQIVLRRVIQRIQGQEESTPEYSHVPLVLGPSGEKLSKRSPTTKSILEYKAEGYLPEAIAQFILGVGNTSVPKDKAISMDELVELYDETKNSKVNVAYSDHMLNFMNRLHIRNKTADELNELLGTSYQAELLDEMKYRSSTLRELEEDIAVYDKALKEFYDDLKAIADNGYPPADCESFRTNALNSKGGLPLDRLIELGA